MCCRLQVLSSVKPEEKKKFISKLQNDQNIVAMVGDGINDAAALAASHIGIAMGGGVGAASEVSSIVLMGNRLSQVVTVSFSIVYYKYKILVSTSRSQLFVEDRRSLPSPNYLPIIVFEFITLGYFMV